MSNIEHVKYPRTSHVPWSLGAEKDDIISNTVDSFAGREVVVTEMMDGECTTMYKDHIHARSIDSKYHQSRTRVAALHAEVRYKLKDSIRICGENMFWVHSIVYTQLKAYFLVFNAWEDSTCLSWDDTKSLAERLDLTLVPELYRGPFDVDAIKALWSEDKSDTMEGYVVRVADSFERDDFQNCVAKFVRKDHVQTDEHWLRSGGELNMLRL